MKRKGTQHCACCKLWDLVCILFIVSRNRRLRLEVVLIHGRWLSSWILLLGALRLCFCLIFTVTQISLIYLSLHVYLKCFLKLLRHFVLLCIIFDSLAHIIVVMDIDRDGRLILMQFQSEHIYESFLFLLLIINLPVSVFLFFGRILFLVCDEIFGANWLRVLAVLVVFIVLVWVIILLVAPVVFAVASIGVAVAETLPPLTFEAVLMVRLLLLILLYWALLSILLVRRGRLLVVAVLVGFAWILVVLSTHVVSLLLHWLLIHWLLLIVLLSGALVVVILLVRLVVPIVLIGLFVTLSANTPALRALIPIIAALPIIAVVMIGGRSAGCVFLARRAVVVFIVVVIVIRVLLLLLITLVVSEGCLIRLSAALSEILLLLLLSLLLLYLIVFVVIPLLHLVSLRWGRLLGSLLRRGVDDWGAARSACWSSWCFHLYLLL